MGLHQQDEAHGQQGHHRAATHRRQRRGENAIHRTVQLSTYEKQVCRSSFKLLQELFLFYEGFII